MNKVAATGLRDSIESWEHKKEAEIPSRDIEPYAENCPLCTLFYGEMESSENCTGCPISLDTGLSVCRGTPWEEAEEAYSKWELRYEILAPVKCIISAREEWREAAQKMIDYMKSLQTSAIVS